MAMNDPYNLNRFIIAQAEIYETVLTELQQGSKTSHWMWFIFPQVKGLGTSTISIRYAINSGQEATAYLAHPILGKRIRECTQIVLDTVGRTANQIFGNIDALKFRSSITLFNDIAANEIGFKLALDKYFNGLPDNRTLEILARWKTSNSNRG